VSRRLIAAVACAGATLLSSAAAAAAYADATPPPPPECSSSSVSCSYDGTQWNVYDNNAPDSPPNLDPTDNGPNVGELFGIFAGIAIGLGVLTTVWRVRAARKIASDAGMNPDAAAAATLLGTGGLTATYLAANLHPRPTAPDDAGVRHAEPPVRSTEDRLGELKRLHDEGVITDDEYTRRRTAILDSV